MTNERQDSGWKEKVLYSTAVASFLAGVGMTFLSFLTKGSISGEILGFVGECFTLTGGIFGITIYMKHKFGEIANYIKEREYEHNGVNEASNEA